MALAMRAAAKRLLNVLCRSGGPICVESVSPAIKLHYATSQAALKGCKRDLHIHAAPYQGIFMPRAVRELLRQANHQSPAKKHYSSWQNRRRLIPEIPEQTALYGLIAANVAGFFLWRADPGFMQRHATTSWDAVKAGRWHTVVTSAFSQRDTMHLLSNMIGLYFFGRNVAWLLGGKGLLLLYLAGGTFGSLVYVCGQALQERDTTSMRRSTWLYSDGQLARHMPALGASGAVNSIVIFDILVAPSATVLIYGILPVQAWILGCLWLYQDISGALGHGKSNIGYTVHLGGAAVGAAAYLAMRRGRIPTRWQRWR